MAGTGAHSPFDSMPPPAHDDADPRVGSLFADRYLITRLIGHGGMARVYEAQHRVIRRIVAVKVLHAEYASDEDLVRRFVNEGRAAGTIGHPNIVESLDMGIAPDGSPFLVLEFLTGTPLSDELRRCPTFPIERAAYVGWQIASALAAAHAHGVVHRDVKPENVFLTIRDGRDDHVKVLDFGISMFRARPGQESPSEAGMMLGTPEYMAPEQLYGDGEIDERTDVYALGLLLHEMIGGRPAFRGLGMPGLVRAVLLQDPPPLELLRPETPPELCAIVRRAHAKRKDQRWSSMSELAAKLEPFVGFEDIPIPLSRRFVKRPSWRSPPMRDRLPTPTLGLPKPTPPSTALKTPGSFVQASPSDVPTRAGRRRARSLLMTSVGVVALVVTSAFAMQTLARELLVMAAVDAPVATVRPASPAARAPARPCVDEASAPSAAPSVSTSSARGPKVARSSRAPASSVAASASAANDAAPPTSVALQP